VRDLVTEQLLTRGAVRIVATGREVDVGALREGLRAEVPRFRALVDANAREIGVERVLHLRLHGRRQRRTGSSASHPRRRTLVGKAGVALLLDLAAVRLDEAVAVGRRRFRRRRVPRVGLGLALHGQVLRQRHRARLHARLIDLADFLGRIGAAALVTHIEHCTAANPLPFPAGSLVLMHSIVAQLQFSRL